MAPPTISPTISNSSHTLSAQSTTMLTETPLIAAIAEPELHKFIQPTPALQSAALSSTKDFLDYVASTVSNAQIARRNENRKKRKRGDRDGDEEVLQLKKIHVEGFGADQVWEQARRVIEAARREVEATLPEEEVEDEGYQSQPMSNGKAKDFKPMQFDEDGFEIGSSDEEGKDSIDDEEPSEEDEDDEIASDEEFEGGRDDFDEADLMDEDAEDIEGEELDGDESEDDAPAQEYKPDPFNLNDGFFSIDDFNRQSEFLEQQDARGDPDDGAASDEEEVDWDADPMAVGAAPSRKSRPQDQDDDMDDDEEDEENGPTFGNIDINAPEGASDDGFSDADELEEGDMDGLGGMGNTNNIMYADFFAPPPSKAGKNKNKKKRGRPNPHNFPPKQDTEDDIERTMSAVHRDLFEDDDPADVSDALSDLDPSDPRSRRSNHERRQAKLLEEIRKLEAANVAKRQWTLSGEARAADRPLNSLLEEDLEFERAGKPVPVITAEVSEDIEALIKRRIIAEEFNGIAPRRPDDLGTGPVRRGRIELDDTKPKQSLAEVYEEEHLRLNDPNYVDARSEKLKKEHREIEALWKDVSAKLDALSSWHYKPKPAAPNLDIRVDAPAITMEDARPNAGTDVGASMLAPQEVYAPGQERAKGEVVTKGGLPVAREEMTREEKLRRRRREKERLKKAEPEQKQKGKGGKKRQEREGIIGDLKKGGVKVIGKGGDVKTVDGKDVKAVGRKGGASFKL